jgi:hypothetical protein
MCRSPCFYCRWHDIIITGNAGRHSYSSTLSRKHGQGGASVASLPRLLNQRQGIGKSPSMPPRALCQRTGWLWRGVEGGRGGWLCLCQEAAAAAIARF